MKHVGGILLSLLMLFSMALAEEEAEDNKLLWDGECWTLTDGAINVNYISDCWYINELRLPDSVKVIKEGALYSLGAHRLVVPEGVETIEGWCMEYSSVERLTLPSTVKNMDACSFSESLRYIRIAEDNPYFQVVDDVLFTKDGKTLVFYPPEKRDLHYDVPTGVTTIGVWAFNGNHWLQTLSLPMGVTTLEKGAISYCGQLEAVSLPLSVKTIGDFAFSDCVRLQRLSIPEGAELGERCLENCPLLSGVKKIGEEAGTQKERSWWTENRHALLSPANVKDMVRIYAQPNDKSRVVARGASGSYVMATEEENGFVHVMYYSDQNSEAGEEGYVKREELVLPDAWEPLFTIETLKVKDKLTGSIMESRMLPTKVMVTQKPKDALSFYWSGRYGQWLDGYWVGYANDDNEPVLCKAGEIPDGYWVDTYKMVMLWLGDLSSCKRCWTGDNKTYGMVVSDSPGNRVNLREKPSSGSHHLNKYFTGTQLEVLDTQGDWHHVRMVDGTEGYMMKQYVMIVEQEEF